MVLLAGPSIGTHQTHEPPRTFAVAKIRDYLTRFAQFPLENGLTGLPSHSYSHAPRWNAHATNAWWSQQ